MNRREFAKNSALAGLGAAMLPYADLLKNMAPDNRHIGVQLWSVREEVADDLEGTIKQIAKFGYSEVETFMIPPFEKGKIFGKTAKEFKTILKDYELKTPSGHYPLPFKKFDAKQPLGDDVKYYFDFAAMLGQKYVILPYVMPDDRSEENFGKIIGTLNAAAEHAKTMNMFVGYHNHDFEFQLKKGDTTYYEWMLKETSAEVAFEMDVYWVNKAKNNAIELFKKYPGRFPLLHMKDMADTTERETIEIGEGLIDFEAIIKEKRVSGSKYFIVELEHYQDTPLNGIKKCYKSIDQLLEKKKK